VRSGLFLGLSLALVSAIGLGTAGAGSYRSTRPVLQAGAPAGVPFGSTKVDTNVNITNKTGAQSETSVAVDPTNRSHLLAASNDLSGSGTTHAYESFNGGQTWVEAGVGITGFCYDPWVDFNAAGDAFFAYECSDQRIAYRKVGQTQWTRTVFNGAGGFPDRSMVVADTMAGSPNLGHVYVGYDDAGANNAAFVMKSNDGFANWTRSPKINDAGVTIGNNIATLPDGSITAVWEDFNAKQVKVDTSSDGGVTWGTDHVVTNYRLATGSFFLCIPPQPQRCVVPMPFSDADLTGNHAGRLYVTYPDKDPTAADWNVYVRFSDNNGATWSPEVKVNDDAGGAYQFFPAITVSDNGTVAVSWYDTRNDPTNKKTDRYWAYSTDGGVTWSTNEKITSAMSDESGAGDPNDYGDYEGIDAFPGAKPRFANVWTDSRPGTVAEDMFYARVKP
jgi:hypothetical protein